MNKYSTELFPENHSQFANEIQKDGKVEFKDLAVGDSITVEFYSSNEQTHNLYLQIETKEEGASTKILCTASGGSENWTQARVVLEGSGLSQFSTMHRSNMIVVGDCMRVNAFDPELLEQQLHDENFTIESFTNPINFNAYVKWAGKYWIGEIGSDDPKEVLAYLKEHPEKEILGWKKVYMPQIAAIKLEKQIPSAQLVN